MGRPRNPTHERIGAAALDPTMGGQLRTHLRKTKLTAAQIDQLTPLLVDAVGFARVPPKLFRKTHTQRDPVKAPNHALYADVRNAFEACGVAVTYWAQAPDTESAYIAAVRICMRLANLNPVSDLRRALSRWNAS